MTTAIDTNIFIALWDSDPATNATALDSLDAAFRRGNLIISAPVFAELIAAPGRSELFVSKFFDDVGIAVDWQMSEATWRAAGQAFKGYVGRRRKARDSGARRILADFLIGAHAAVNGYRLLTLDERVYRAAFPNLVVLNA